MGTSPLFVLLFYWTFRRIPPEVFAAARLDGAGLLGLWAHDRHAAGVADHRRGRRPSLRSLLERLHQPAALSEVRERYTLPVGLQILQQMDKTNWPLLMAGARHHDRADRA